MNRAERRALKRNGYNEFGQKVYKLTQKQLDDLVVRAMNLKRREILDDVSTKVTRAFMVLCLDVLNSKFGFGEMRLKRFKYFLDDVSELIVDDYGDVNDIIEDLGERVNLDFMSRRIELDEIYSPSHFGDYEQLAPYPTKDKENENESAES